MPADYSEELVELVARTIHATISHCRSQAHLRAYPDATCPAGRHLARLAVDALSAAGRLVPPGSETREEWGVRANNGIIFDGFPEDEARRGAARFSAGCVLRRTHIVTPWSPSVPDSKEETNG